MNDFNFVRNLFPFRFSEKQTLLCRKQKNSPKSIAPPQITSK